MFAQPAGSQQGAASYDTDRQTISLLVGFAPGGSEDVRARAVATKLSEIMGRPVVVVNRAGASGTLALSQLAKAKPDGLTIGSVTASSLIYAGRALKSDFQTSDFTYLAGAASQPYCICVRQDAPWKSLEEFLADAKSRPGEISYGHPGVGHFSNVIAEVIARMRGAKLIAVPFKGDADSITALLGGHVHAVSLASTFVPYATSGQLRPLVILGENRVPLFPDVPTIQELGFQVNMKSSSLLGFGAPKGLPPEIRERLEKALAAAIKSSEFKSALERMNNTVVYRTSEQFSREVDEVKVSAERMFKEIEQ
jgi:tripartite-type tricarboxylate transporter receptor subunit TctC